MPRGCWRLFVIDQRRLAGEIVEHEDGGEIGVAGVFKDAEDGLEGGAVIGEIGKTDNAKVVAGNADHEVIEAAGAAGVKEESGGGVQNEPSGCVVPFATDRKLQTFEGLGQVDQF